MRLLHHPRFRAAYDFLCLRAETGDKVQEQARWWTKAQEEGSPESQGGNAKREGGSGGRRNRRRRRRRAAGAPLANAT